MTKSIKDAHEELVRFLNDAKEPAVIEPGMDPIPLVAGAYNIDRTQAHCFLEAWTRDRTLSRRLTGLLETKRHSVRFSTERFGKRQGTLNVVDLAAPRAGATTLKASRQTFREQFRRSLLRQFPGWRVAELSTDPDLEHSLSPAYPRALLRKGQSAYAAIACPPQSQDPDGVVTFGLIWLNYVRRRDAKSKVLGLAVFLPDRKHRAACLRMLHLRTDETEWSAFIYTARSEDRVDLQDYGNISTTLPVRSAGIEKERADWTRLLSDLPNVTEREDPSGGVAWTVHGLPFAHWETGKGLVFGIETKHKGRESNRAEIEALARELGRFRSAQADDRTNPLYLKKPELWLEAQVRSSLREIDASLDGGTVYRQAPAIAGGDRSVLDLLAVDHAGCLAIVEVKVTEDLHLPLQALDYWIRVRWHAVRDDFRRAGYFPGIAVQTRAPRLLLVAPALAFHPTTEAVIHHFAPEVCVDLVGLGMDWRNQVKVMFRKTRAVRP